MTTSLPCFLHAGLLALALAAPAAAADAGLPPVPTRDFFSLPNVRAPKLSPDGKKIAFLFPHEQRLALGLFDRETKESRMILRGEDESIYSFFWKSDDRIVFLADASGNESFFIGVTDLTGKKILRLAESQRIEDNLTGTFALLVSQLAGDPERIVLAAYFADNV
ncbi:MAG: hypothetical protein EXS32_06685 [Opitutus sp.]|nr:hypothetical protein [Opitutus sp.]